MYVVRTCTLVSACTARAMKQTDCPRPLHVWTYSSCQSSRMKRRYVRSCSTPLSLAQALSSADALTAFHSMHRMKLTRSGVMGRLILTVGKLSSENAEFCAKNYLGDIGTNSKFWAPIISFVGILEPSVRILLEICSLCWKIATSCFANFQLATLSMIGVGMYYVMYYRCAHISLHSAETKPGKQPRWSDMPNQCKYSMADKKHPSLFIFEPIVLEQRSSYWHGCRPSSVCRPSVKDVMWPNGKS